MNDLDWLARNVNEWPSKPVQGLTVGYYSTSRYGADPDYVRIERDDGVGDEITLAQWKAKRDELINKPDWNDAPEWVEYIAQWRDGQWMGYEVKPEEDLDINDCGCYVDTRTNPRIHYFQPYGEPLNDWRTTLEQRPKEDSYMTDKEWKGPGDGLPPVSYIHTKAIRRKPGCEDFELCSVDKKGMAFKISVMFDDDNNIIGVKTGKIQTEEDNAVGEMLDVVTSHYTDSDKMIPDSSLSDDNWRSYLSALYRAGYRKQEE